MIKFTLKSFILSLKYFFIPLLIMAIALVPAVIYFYFFVQSQMNELTTSLSTELNSISYDLNGLIEYVFDEAKALPWTTPFKTIKMMFDEGWLGETIKTYLENSNASIYTAAMTGNVKETANNISGGLGVFPIAIIAGLIVSYFVTASVLRKKLCPRSFWKMILNIIIDFIITTTLVAFITALLGLWIHSVFITTFLTALLYGFISISEAYIIHRDEKMKYRDVVNVKTLFSLIFSYLLILAIAVIIIVLLFLLPWKILSLALALPVIIIAFINYNLAAEGYVRSKRKDYGKIEEHFFAS
jgi:hypothetical protein